MPDKNMKHASEMKTYTTVQDSVICHRMPFWFRKVEFDSFTRFTSQFSP